MPLSFLPCGKRKNEYGGSRKKNNRRWFRGQEKLKEVQPGSGGKEQATGCLLVSAGKRSILKKGFVVSHG
jgi:hypothetical protein